MDWLPWKGGDRRGERATELMLLARKESPWTCDGVWMEEIEVNLDENMMMKKKKKKKKMMMMKWDVYHDH